MRWLTAFLAAVLILPPAQAAEGWMVGDLVGAAVVGADGRVIGRIGDLYADQAGRVRAVQLDAPGGAVLVPWPALHVDPAGHLARLSGGVQRNGAPPPGLVSLEQAVGSPVTFHGGVLYGRVATVKIGRGGIVEAVMVKPAAPAALLYPLAWSALDYHSLPQAAPQLAGPPE